MMVETCFYKDISKNCQKPVFTDISQNCQKPVFAETSIKTVRNLFSQVFLVLGGEVR